MNAERLAYVQTATRIIELHQGDRETLVTWWTDEKTNREKWKLSPYQWPGSDLDQAFREKLRSFKNVPSETE